MKRLLFSALTALCAFSANAAVGDYVYTPQGRFMITSETDLMNGAGAFTSETLDGWQVLPDTAKIADQFAVGVDGGVNYAYSLQSDVNEGMKFTTANLDPAKTYVVSYKMRNAVESAPSFPLFTMLEPSASHQNGANVVSITGAVDETNVVTYNAGTETTTDWVTYCFAIEGDRQQRTLTISLNSMSTTLQIADMKIVEAVKVADDRDAKLKADYALAAYNLTDWTKFDSDLKQSYPAKDLIIAYGQVAEITDDMRTVLAKYIDPATIDAECPGFTDNEEEYAKRVEKYTEKLDAFRSNAMFAFIDVTKNDPASTNTSYEHLGFNTTGKVQKASTIGGWTVVSPSGRGFAEKNNWTHLGHFQGSNVGGLTVGELKREFELFAGVYMFTVDLSASVYLGTSGSAGDSWTSNTSVSAGDGYVYITDAAGQTIATTETVALPPTAPADENSKNWASFILPIKIQEDGKYTVHIIGNNKYSSEKYGGSILIRYPELYGQSLGEFTAAQKDYITKVRAQIAAMRTAYDTSVKYAEDTEGKYSWYKQSVADTAAIYKEFLDFYEGLSDADIVNGFEDPLSKAAKAEWTPGEGEDPEAWDYVFSFEKYDLGKQNATDSLTNRSVRPLLRLNEHFLAYNQVLFDFVDAINKGKAALSDRMSAGKTGYATLEGVVSGAEGAYNDYKEDPGDATTLVDEYIPAVQDATAGIIQAITEFNESGYNPGEEPVIIRNFDFEDAAAFALDDPTVESGTGTGKYTSETGVMTFNALETTANGTAFANGWYDGSAWTNQGILRVGNGNGTIALNPEEMVSGSDGLHVSCDYYFGNLSGKEGGIYLEDSEGGKVAGLLCSKYSGTSSYNPFGVDYNADFSAVGSSGNENEKIIAASNKTHFDFYLDYGLKTMYVVINNESKKTVNKRYDVAMDNQNPVAAIVINSNYNNSGRRSWVDNVVIEKIPLPVPAGYYAVKIAEGIENGTVIAVPSTAKAGDEVTIKATPAEGYELASVTVTCVNSTQAVEVVDGKFTMPEDDVTVNAVFQEKPKIKGDVNGDGVVDGADIQEVINTILSGEYVEKADVNKDQVVDGADIQEIINIILGN